MIEEQPPAWKSRIVGSAEVAPGELLANPLNWRVHPKAQQQVLEAALNSIGWIQQVIVNRTTGHMIDGHARVQIALRRGEAKVPVVYVQLSADEERAALASLDPLAALAVTDPEALLAVTADLSTGNTAFDRFLAEQRAIAEGTSVKGGPSAIRMGQPASVGPVIKIVLPASELALAERALDATGLLNRGDAFAALCRAYLDAKHAEGQHDAASKVGAAPVAAEKTARPAGRVRNARRVR